MPTGYMEYLLYVKNYKSSDDGNAEVTTEKFRIKKYIAKL
jgi:hypothetical protein